MERVDLHYINADLDCEICKMRMADVLILVGRRAGAYHQACIPADWEACSCQGLNPGCQCQVEHRRHNENQDNRTES